MNETSNPFEQAMNMPVNASAPSGGMVPDPFGIASRPAPEATPTGNTFGEKPIAPATLPADLGSQPAANPFETPEETQDPQADSTQTAPIIDIGNQPTAASPFAETELADAQVKEINGAQLTVLEPLPADEAQPEDEEIANPLVAAMNELDKAEQQSIFAKPPIFEHGAVKELIEDLTQTFEDLRIAKADDFPELEDSVRVSWSVTYGKVVKSVATPKKTAIGEFKKSIESSKEFIDALKKDKNKSPDCVIKPKITAQSKGDKMPLPNGMPVEMSNDIHPRMPLYKGVFTNVEDARASGKAITIVPASDGRVYEIRNEEMGTFATPIDECRELSDIQAGFTPALPLIPRSVLLDVISFFRTLMHDGQNYEAIANIYWDRRRGSFIAVIPKQRVTSVKAESELSDDYPPERYLHYMDVHSHNVMPARFSMQDDHDEKATRLYAVIGKLYKTIPEMSVRISNGGTHLLVDPATVFDAFGDYYPVKWDGRDVRDPDISRLAKMIIMAFDQPQSKAAVI